MEREDGSTEEQGLFFRKGASETLLHLLIKLLSYVFFWDSGHELTIEPNFRLLKYKPDLVAFMPSDIPNKLDPDVALWVECKHVRLKKLARLAKALPNAQIYWFHLEGTLQTLLQGAKVRRLLQPHENLKLIGIGPDKHVIESIALELGTSNPTWVLKREGRYLEIHIERSLKTMEYVMMEP